MNPWPGKDLDLAEQVKDLFKTAERQAKSCPWCGAGQCKPDSEWYECDSYQKNKYFSRSDNCRIQELEAALEKMSKTTDKLRTRLKAYDLKLYHQLQDDILDLLPQEFKQNSLGVVNCVRKLVIAYYKEKG